MEHFSNFLGGRNGTFFQLFGDKTSTTRTFSSMCYRKKTQSFSIALNRVMLSIKTNHHGLLFSAGIDFDLYGTRRGTDAFDFYVVPFAFDAKVRLDLK